MDVWSLEDISINAPLTGGDVFRGFILRASAISINAPLTGGD